jgi:uncharacterized protein YndB with AHSA1/START domain
VVVDAVADNKYLHYAVGRHIEAAPEVVWAVLTDAPGYTDWNSTVVALDGVIEDQGELELQVHVAPGRTFPLTVSRFEAPRHMVWEDGNESFRGVRTFTLTAADGGTDFTMKEAFTGRFMKMIAPKLPDFTADFDAFARDLAREAESRVPAGVAVSD